MYFYVHINHMPETRECTDILYLGPKRNHPKKEGQQKLQSKLPLSSKVEDLQNSVSLRKDPVRKTLCRPLTQSKAPGWRHVFLLHYRISESFKPWFRRWCRWCIAQQRSSSHEHIAPEGSSLDRIFVGVSLFHWDIHLQILIKIQVV